MWPLAKFYLRQGNLEKAEQYMRDSLSYDVNNDKVMMIYASLLCSINRVNEATILFKSLLNKGYEKVKV
jgi:Tfp pilus assembly protein PilF